MDMDILQDYLPEARELLDKAQAELLVLEKDPGNDPVINSVFRAFHTLKGGAGFLDAEHLVRWTHHLEDLLDKARSHVIQVTPGMIDVLFQAMDVIYDMLNTLADGGRSPSPGPEALGNRIIAMANGETVGVSSPKSPTPEPTPSSAPNAQADESSAGVLHVDRTEKGLLLTNGVSPAAAPKDHAAATGDDGSISQDEFEQVLTSLYGDKAPGVASDLKPATTPAATPKPATTPAAATDGPESTLRVDAARLDAVMNQVGEMVLLRNRLSSAVATMETENEAMTRIAREMDLAVTDIQGTVMRLRMQPCKRLFQQLPRIVRDASRQLNKTVRLELSGEDVEIDKTVVDALSGPMTHLIRNSLDHGIETPDERATTGKSREAVIRVAAIHLGDKVRIEVSDDGRGIDRRFVTEKAISKGVVTREQAARLSEQEALELIFQPGFSTRDQATDLSGRGVGMDVVRETVRKLRGRLEIDTTLGQGTRIAMEFPLTMAVLPVLYIRLRQETYALPISAVDSLLAIELGRRHMTGGQSLYAMESGAAVKIVNMGGLLHGRDLDIGKEPVEGILMERGLLLVSAVMGNEDSVVKPIDFLENEGWYQGATISGQGRVVPILDPTTLMRGGKNA
ncbi:MAG: chemotaxis protein CheA [Acidithiobacillus sp.]